MAGVVDQAGEVPGFTVAVHRALTEPILLGGAPRAIAIMNGTLAGAVGLGLRLWLVGIAIWAMPTNQRRRPRPTAPASVPFMMAMARGAPPSRIGSVSAR